MKRDYNARPGVPQFRQISTVANAMEGIAQIKFLLLKLKESNGYFLRDPQMTDTFLQGLLLLLLL